MSQRFSRMRTGIRTMTRIVLVSLPHCEAHMNLRPFDRSCCRMAARALGAAAMLWLLGAAPVPAALTSPPDRCFAPCAYLGDRALFGTREMIGHDFSRFREWRKVMARSRAEFAAARGICAAGQTNGCIPAQWASLLAALDRQPLRRQIALANDALNRIPYVPTEQNWHRAMYWETPFEFLRRGGQCQDYAIAKYELLRHAGVPASAMRMVVVRDTAIARDHAVLVVYVDGEPLVLDILNPAILPADARLPYRPYYSINEDAWWYHLGPHSMEGWMQALARREADRRRVVVEQRIDALARDELAEQAGQPACRGSFPVF